MMTGRPPKSPNLAWFESELAILKVIGIVAEIDVAVVDDAAGVGRSLRGRS